MLTHPMPTRGAHARAVAAAIALTSLLSLPSGAAAGTATTPVLFVPSGYTFWCALTNLGSRPLENLVVEQVKFDGTVGGTLPVDSLAPGETHAAGGPFIGFGYCRVEGVSRRKVNLTACAQATITSPCASITTNN